MDSTKPNALRIFYICEKRQKSPKRNLKNLKKKTFIIQSFTMCKSKIVFLDVK